MFCVPSFTFPSGYGRQSRLALLVKLVKYEEGLGTALSNVGEVLFDSVKDERSARNDGGRGRRLDKDSDNNGSDTATNA